MEPGARGEGQKLAIITPVSPAARRLSKTAFFSRCIRGLPELRHGRAPVGTIGGIGRE